MKSFDDFHFHDLTGEDRQIRAAAEASQRLRQYYLCGSPLELNHLLFATRSHSCTELRDKKPSILNLLSEVDIADTLLRVRCTKPWTIIFGLAPQLILTKSIADLNVPSYSAENSNDDRLPS